MYKRQAHPHARIRALHARNRDGRPLADEFRHLAPLGLELSDGEPEPGSVDVAFLALPHGASAELAVRLAGGGTTVVDIGSDLRLRAASAYPEWYGFDHPAPRPAPDTPDLASTITSPVSTPARANGARASSVAVG